MIEPGRVVAHLASLGVDMYTGVPDSLLKEFGKHVMAELPREQHIIAANEGASVGIALGHYLRTGRPALVYLQNSGFGNTVNPLLSLADPTSTACRCCCWSAGVDSPASRMSRSTSSRAA
jgi:phosphonopyruvate decarboxylase